MKITVDRTKNPEGDLIFTITVKEPHVAPFPEEEKTALVTIDNFMKHIAKDRLDPNGKLYQDILNANHNVKEKVFLRILDNLKFSIENEFRPMFKPICQEIYNWIQDNQEGYIKTWMSEFDPQRTTYYFHNDEVSKNHIKNQINHVVDDKFEDEEEDDDED